MQLKVFLRRLVMSFMSLIISLTIFGTVTYAWFSFATTNILDNLTLNIATGDGFEISLDGINFYRKLPVALIREALGDELKLRDVTSPNGIDFYGGPLGEGQVRENVDYASLTFWFRATAADKRFVYLVDDVSGDIAFDESADGTYVISKGITWRSDATFQYGPDPDDIIYAGGRDVYYGADAIRISFIEVFDKENTLDTRFADELSRFIYDPSGNPERGFGREYGAVAYFRAKRKEDPRIPNLSPEVSYELSKFSDANPYIPLSKVSQVMQLVRSSKRSPEGKTYYMGILKVNIWFEGWDADCFNAIYRDTIRIQLRFKAGRTIDTSDLLENIY